jgi:hypothetical protein
MRETSDQRAEMELFWTELTPSVRRVLPLILEYAWRCPECILAPCGRGRRQ